jgi:hypothetical protein
LPLWLAGLGGRACPDTHRFHRGLLSIPPSPLEIVCD